MSADGDASDPSRATRRPVIVLVLMLVLGGGLAGCGLLEVAPASEITAIEPISVRARVIELGPHNPERAAFPSVAPIVEFLPGDRVRLEVEVVDLEGLALPESELDSVWFHHGATSRHGMPPLDDPLFDVRCDALDQWALESVCRIGEGTDGIEFVAPPIGENLWAGFGVYAVVAWNGESAEACWTARREDKAIAPNCGFIRFDADVGPPWWLYDYAASLGVISPVLTDQFPVQVYAQQANRAPLLDHIILDINDQPNSDQPNSQLLAPNAGRIGPVAVEPGDVVRARIVLEPNSQLSQTEFHLLSPEADLFTVSAEYTGTRTSTAGPITLLSEQALPRILPIVIQVHADAEPGIARAVVVVLDARGGESVVRLELDIQ